ncbi:MAG: LPS export ABC transporter periplasmic protein LptC [Bacteroidetes bacterium]|jgi:LPS export ABC transporter protein LptC|nr:LPS export ABC transporter periplasmic protein LptC [Bacteroidota bacterium]MBK9319954.1 LPS export ABC transporter periplasmic protein LptC [Bacteroidota bacterium]
MKIGSKKEDLINLIMRTSRLFFNRRSLDFLFLLTFAGVLSACENDQTEIKRITEQKNEPVEHIKGLETLYSDSGLVRVRVRAPELKKIVSPQNITEMPQGIHIEFFDPEMKVESELKAKYAVHYENEKRWEARKDVVVVNKKGEMLNTELLIWNERNEKLTSDQHVKITTEDEIIYGDGFEANQDFSLYKIFNVRGRITVKK